MNSILVLAFMNINCRFEDIFRLYVSCYVYMWKCNSIFNDFNNPRCYVSRILIEFQKCESVVCIVFFCLYTSLYVSSVCLSVNNCDAVIESSCGLDCFVFFIEHTKIRASICKRDDLEPLSQIWPAINVFLSLETFESVSHNVVELEFLINLFRNVCHLLLTITKQK